ncbi:hypothetical protein RR46_01992 [Papilio xuthus]|uniref:Uncharacterized protein n=1 Tax=Papilio xuthus TaxID=66420 RepID=A0A194QI94_PAPXU|nr:hypothetical protein RR46_01992 [Papilio xuthus]
MNLYVFGFADDRTEGDDDTSQGSQPKDESSESENEIEPQSHNGGSPSPEVHEITSDEDDGAVTNDDDSSSSSTDSNDSSEESQQSTKDREEEKKKDEEAVENGGDESDIEEVSAEDPLNQAQKSKPIVISDAKSLADLTSKQSKSNEGENKEPTVVIIDTNSIMSGKNTSVQNKSSTSNFDAHNLCQSIAARGTTITPVSCKGSTSSKNNTTTAPQPNILPSLTDDMFVVEAPSFIVPYVYEKPSVKPFREFVDKLGKQLDEVKLKEDLEKMQSADKKDKGKHDKSESDEEGDSDKESKKEMEEPPKEKKPDKKKRRRPNTDDDDSWDGESSSESDEDALSDDDTVVIKEKDDAELKDPISIISKGLMGKGDSYFDCSLGQFFINIGLNLVQEYVQSDLLKHQNRKLYKEKKSGRSTKATESAIVSLTQNLEFSKKTNAPYALQQKKCEFCSFKTESMLIMAHHLEAPHMKNNINKL